MNAVVARVLLVADDPAELEALRSALSGEKGVHLEVAHRLQEALPLLRRRPHLVIGCDRLLTAEDWALARRLGETQEDRGITVMLTDPGAHELRLAALEHAVDEFLHRPLDPADVRAKVRGMLRLKRAYDTVRADGEELERLHHALQESFDRLLELLARILDLALPGAADRGRRVAELSAGVAERFGVPVELRRDLEIAARLHELGRVMVPGNGGDSSSVGTEGWAGLVATRTLLETVDGLAGAAEVVGAVCENWDGTGRPDHLQQGQIPLRSRILRVVTDYVHALERPGHARPAEVLARMMEQRGVRYDPLALVYLEAVATGGAVTATDPQRQVIPITELEVGMILADDLYTESGLKLLSRGARLGPAALEAIQRRHRSEPMIHGAVVYRRVA